MGLQDQYQVGIHDLDALCRKKSCTNSVPLGVFATPVSVSCNGPYLDFSEILQSPFSLVSEKFIFVFLY